MIDRDQFAEWLEIATSGTSPLNQRRERMRSLAQRELLQRTGSEDVWKQASALKAAINTAWPTQKPVDSSIGCCRDLGQTAALDPADQLLVDEANSMLNGSPFTYGHVIVDEAQDHSAVALRVIGRRSPTGSMTLVGDVAQSTTPAGRSGGRPCSITSRSATVRGRDCRPDHRLPGARADPRVANRLLPFTGVDATESRSVRRTGELPTWLRVES